MPQTLYKVVMPEQSGLKRLQVLSPARRTGILPGRQLLQLLLTLLEDLS